jgi:hypothetical protein
MVNETAGFIAVIITTMFWKAQHGGFSVVRGWIGALLCVISPTMNPAIAVDFETDVQPILKQHCLACHGTDVRKAELDLTTVAGIQRGSESGPILSEDLPQSRLLEVVLDGEMPPEDEDQLSLAEVETLRRWIIEGATLPMPSEPDAQRVTDQHHALPIMLRACATCHGRQVQEGGLDIRTRASLLKGGKTGPAIEPGRPEESLLLQRIKNAEMPPREKLATHSVKPVQDDELQKLDEWIGAGAPWIEFDADVGPSTSDRLVTDGDREYWSFQPPRQAPLPAVIRDSNSVEVETAVDAFIVEQLRARELTLSPPADRPTLLRRLYFDLIGLPPDAAAIAAFMDDDSPLAYRKVVDRLLASPAYGERWGQYWLDLAGYSDSEGVQHSDPIRPYAYRYRDYVIAAFNADEAYDQFLRQQIAGDELVDYENAAVITQEIYENLVATGFLRMTSDGTFAGITGFLPNRLDVIDDQIRVLSSSVMGLTLRCARCHSHKFDPIPQRDYYQLAAIFKGAMDEFDWMKPIKSAVGRPRYLPFVTPRERRAWEDSEAHISAQIKALESAKADLNEPGSLSERGSPNNPSTETEGSEEASTVEQLKQLDDRIKQLEAERTPEPMVRALWDVGEPSPTYLLGRGDFRRPIRVVGPGVPAVLSSADEPFHVAPPWPGAKKTGARLALAQWLTRSDHPLTARVLVNRIWKHHFGRGLVEPLDDFGRAGGRPSHPQLLDWLAVRFVNEGWSIKALHRLLLNSAVYRQSSEVGQRHEQLDPDNHWLSRMPLQRMDAEALRDTLIALSGKLDRRQFGPAAAVDAREDGLVMSAAEAGGWRRSIYVLKRRTERLTILDNFDRPRMSPNCISRPTSNVSTQALHLLNNRMIHELSRALALRLVDEAGPSAEARIERLFMLTLGRGPSAEEQSLALATLTNLRDRWDREENSRHDSPDAEIQNDVRALANVSHALINSAAFLYID